MRALHSSALAALAALAPATLAAQGGSQLLGGVEYRSVSFGAGYATKSVSVLAAPLGAVVRVSPRISLDVGTFYANVSHETESGTTTTVSGLTDLQARAVVEVVPDAVVFTLAANLPTGHATLEDAELLVAGAIASDLIPFPISNFGSGAAVTSGVAFAMPMGPWAIGLAGSYRYSGSYQPSAAATTEYQPGGESRLRFGVDRLVGQGRLAIGFTYSTFATDEYGGSGAYRSGGRYIPQASLNVPLGNNSLALYVWDLYRGEGEFFTRDTSAGVASTPAPKANTLAAGAVLALVRGRTVWQPSLEFRVQSQDDGSDSGSLVALGLRYSFPLGGHFSVQPGLRFDTGSAPNLSGSGVSFTGFSGSVMIRTSW